MEDLVFIAAFVGLAVAAVGAPAAMLWSLVRWRASRLQAQWGVASLADGETYLADTDRAVVREEGGRAFRIVPLVNGGARIDVEVDWRGANLRTLGVSDGPVSLRSELRIAAVDGFHGVTGPLRSALREAAAHGTTWMENGVLRLALDTVDEAQLDEAIAILGRVIGCAERREPLDVVVATDPDDEVRAFALKALEAVDPERAQAVAAEVALRPDAHPSWIAERSRVLGDAEGMALLATHDVAWLRWALQGLPPGEGASLLTPDLPMAAMDAITQALEGRPTPSVQAAAQEVIAPWAERVASDAAAFPAILRRLFRLAGTGLDARHADWLRSLVQETSDVTLLGAAAHHLATIEGVASVPTLRAAQEARWDPRARSVLEEAIQRAQQARRGTEGAVSVAEAAGGDLSVAASEETRQRQAARRGQPTTG